MLDLVSFAFGMLVGVPFGLLLVFGFVPLVEWGKRTYNQLRGSETD